MIKIHELLPDWMCGIIEVAGERIAVDYKFLTSEYIACREIDGDGQTVRVHRSKLVYFENI